MQLLSSKTTLEETTPEVRAISSGSTSILAALGITERGPHEATLVSSFPQFQKIFGGYVAASNLCLAIKGFFEEGGSAAWIKRVVHYTSIDDPESKTSEAGELTVQSGASSPSAGSVLGTVVGPFIVEDGQTLVVALDGGGAATATFNGAPATRDAGGAGPYALVNNQTLTVKVDGGPVQTVTFLASEFSAIGAATAAEVAAVLNAKLSGAKAALASGVPRITSDRKGTSSHIEVTGGTANGVLGFSTAVADGSGNVANLAGVTQGEVSTILGAALTGEAIAFEGGRLRISSGTTGGSSSVQVSPSSTALAAFGFDTAVHSGGTGAAADALRVTGKTDGTYANRLSIQITAATSGRATEFNLAVLENGIVRESWPNLSVLADNQRNAEAVLNHSFTGSDRIKVELLGDGLVPAIGTHGPLTGGNDGLVGIVDADFVGNAVSRTGLRGFNTVDGARTLICPDRQTAVVDVAQVDYATSRQSIFPILCSQVAQSIQAARTYIETTTGLLDLSEFGAFYYPQIKVDNPNKAIYGNEDLLVVPPVGHIAGAYARSDAQGEGGIYQAPAGARVPLRFARGLEHDLTGEESNRDLLYPHRINPIVLSGGSIELDGVRTLKGDGNFPSISERRGVIHIEQAILNGTRWVRFRNNDADLRAELERTIEAYLVSQMRIGAFRSRDAASAFLVDVSEALNPPSLVFQGCVIAAVGLATQKPAEFVFLRFSQDTRALSAELAAG